MSDVKRCITYKFSCSLKRVVILLMIALLCITAPFQMTAQAKSTASSDVYASLLKGDKITFPSHSSTPELRTVYLTFDDGPGRYTEEVLDLLQEEGIPATFFVLGELAASYPDLIKRIVNEGHTLGNHTYNHKYAEIYRDFAGFWNQLKETEGILAEIAEVRPRIVRAPGGTYTNFDSFYFYYLQSAGYKIFDWTVDSSDSKRKDVPASEIILNVKRAPLTHEMIVLMHDGGAHRETVKALPEIIQYFKQEGYTFSSITEDTNEVNFRVGPSKWEREYNASKHAEYESMIKERVPYPGYEQLLADQGAMAIRESAALLPFASQYNERTLVISGQGIAMKFSSEDYEINEDRLMVPLRDMVNVLGGHIEWKPDRETAVVGIGQSIYEFQLSNEHMTAYTAAGQFHQLQSSSMKLRKGRLLVPLRDVLSLLNYEITDYSETAEQHEVRFRSKPDYVL